MITGDDVQQLTDILANRQPETRRREMARRDRVVGRLACAIAATRAA